MTSKTTNKFSPDVGEGSARLDPGELAGCDRLGAPAGSRASDRLWYERWALLQVEMEAKCVVDLEHELVGDFADDPSNSLDGDGTDLLTLRLRVTVETRL